MSHENLDVEYYRFDYLFYKRIQLGNIPIARFSLELQLAKKKKKKTKTESFEAWLFLSRICSLAFKVSLQ